MVVMISKIVGAIAGIGTAYLLWTPFFGDKEEFWRCIKFWFTPNIFSMFRGEYWEDTLAETKLVFWIAISIGIGYGACVGIMKLFG